MRSALSLLLVSVLQLACTASVDPSPPVVGSSSDDGGAFGQGAAPTDTPLADNDSACPTPPETDDAADASTSTVGDSADERAVAPLEETAAPTNTHPLDAGPEGACTEPLRAGDLAIDELMIESVAGAGDNGQWLEVQNTLDCVANVRGLHGECPRGAKVATFDVADDLWIPPRGTFVVADSNVPAINHYLPGAVLAWFGHRGDILRKKGTTITLSTRDAVIDSVTYPALPLTVGTSIAFPSDCDPSLRSDWGRWQVSVASWFPGFSGSPNAPNNDIACR